MIFNLKTSQIYKAVIFYKFFPKWSLVFFRVLFLVLGFVPILYWLISQSSKLPFNISIGWSFVFLPCGLGILFFEFFGKYSLRYPKIVSTNNVAEFLEYELADIFDKAVRISEKSGERTVSVKSLAIALIQDRDIDKAIKRIIPDFGFLKSNLHKDLNSASFSIDNETSLVKQEQVSVEVLKLLEGAMAIKDEHGGYRISVLDVLAELFDYNDQFRQFIINQNLDKRDLKELARWYEHIWNFWREYNKSWSYDNLSRQIPIGREWIYGYARHLTSFAVNLTDQVKFLKPSFRLIERTKEIEQIEDILAKSGQNNVLLVGEEGVGKEKIIFDLAGMIVKGRALPQLNYKKVFDLDLSLIAGASKDISDVQNLLLAVLNESSRAGNVILILKNFHNFIGEIGGLGRIDISEILIPYLKSSDIQIIATTNPVSFHKFIENRSEIMDVFERINILEPNPEQALEMIEEVIPSYESKFGVFITYGAIKEIVKGADQFIRSAPFPEKAFDLLAETISFSVANKIRLITTQEVNEVISRKTGVPLGPIDSQEKDKLSNLEELMHKEIVGQDRAVEVIASTMKRLRTGLSKRGRPAGVFLFVGPTGVGKTQTAKVLAKTYFGSKDRMLRFDMSEYQDLESLDRFLGSSRTGEPGQFVSEARDNPFSLILLDELEKANKNVLNIFLQVFDEGSLTDVFGRKVNFEQNIIIATSNAGADFIRDLVKQGLDPSLEKEKIIDVLVQGRYFNPEFLNRFDEIVVFHPLTEEQVGKITELLLNSLADRLKDQGYIFKPNKEIIDYIAKAGFDPQFGARPMERAIRDKIETTIANKILENTLKKGQEFSLNTKDIK